MVNKILVGDVSDGGNHDERDDHAVSARYFSDKKDSRKRACMTPAISPAIPARTKVRSGMLIKSKRFNKRDVRNPRKPL